MKKIKTLFISFLALMCASLVTLSIAGVSSLSPKESHADYVYEHAGTEEDPFTVAEALLKCEEVGKAGTDTDVFVRGIISSISTIDVKGYGNATYFISDDGTRNVELEVYRGFFYKIDEETGDIVSSDFTDENKDELQIGRIVLIKGRLVFYKLMTKEFTSGNYIYSIEDLSKGDFDVTFISTSTGTASAILSVGQTGTFSSNGYLYTHSEATNVTYAYESSQPSIFEIKEDGDHFEVLAKGSAAIKVTATADEGVAYARVYVSSFDELTVDEALTIGEALDPEQNEKSSERYIVSGKLYRYWDQYKRMQLYTPVYGEKIIDVYFGSSYSSVLETMINDGYCCGDTVYVLGYLQNYSGDIQVVEPAFYKGSKEEHMTAYGFSGELLSKIDINGFCTSHQGSDGTDFDDRNIIYQIIKYQVYEAYWSRMTSIEAGKVITANGDENGNIIEQAMARYDYIYAKYNLKDMAGGGTIIPRSPAAGANVETPNQEATQGSLIVLVVALSTSLMLMMVVIIRKKRMIRK